MWRDIYLQLVEEADNYKILLSLLKHKQEVIVTGDLEAIQGATAETDLLLRKIGKIAYARHQAVEQALSTDGKPVDQPRLSALIEKTPEKDRADWRRLAAKITRLMEEIYTVTRENSTLLDTAQKMNQSLLNILLPQNEKLDIYDHSGNVKKDNRPERMMNRQV